ncbi:MAG TPA: hypothetical protein VK906_14235 [Egicoccus sp.]|nr:hypothetical protein [Egicoccus sp.]HSK24339.1 hypothetical protein [Egicoccus sp.]
MKRALLWLGGGLVAFALLVVAIAPELLGSIDVVGGMVALTLLMLVPALLIALIFVSVRRRQQRDQGRGV